MIAYLLLVTLLVALIVSVVASATRDRKQSLEEDARPAAKARQDALLEELRELEFDHETGVVSEEEYASRRPALEKEAVAAHQRVQELGGASPDGASLIREAPAGSSCTSCGAPLREGARFCGRCGSPVVGAAGPDASGARRENA
ncbi:MAG: zinc ribbon domain-containing protein [Candidatus Palauibacterales bacterium]|nr:zinc ribbon domain-containing protein [Candidatus Palauibacterales bacterium]MDP2529618.1 zinc ribbon domain-containing protein [Candidatus Palauibacterales bacterium]MDP2582593.1 zinc ribbon domain-containing protein [Candidatus Palauibacterales bacterium]